MTANAEDFFSIFLEETEELLALAKKDILELEEEYTPILKAELKRIVRTIRGNAAIVQKYSIAESAQSFEESIDKTSDLSAKIIEEWKGNVQKIENLLNEAKQALPDIKSPEVLKETEKKQQQQGYLNAQPTVDKELWNIFLEEAKEISEYLERALEQWHASRENSVAGIVKRQLHTLKGNAKMVGQPFLADVCHGLEEVSQRLLKNWEDDLWFCLQKGVDWIAESIEALKKGTDCIPDNQWLAQLPTIKINIKENPILNRLPKEQKEKKEIKRSIIAPMREPLKLPVELVEKLADLAGVASVSRVAMEQRLKQLWEVSFDFMGGLNKLMDHIRNLEQENEANSQRIMDAFLPAPSQEGRKIDPLQLERYSFFEYLARALHETAHALHHSFEIFKNNLHAGHEILEQQAQATSELEERLSSTRMVSFKTVIPRFQRIVRQVCSDLNKKVKFIVENGDVKIDRNILDSLVPALEHLIRNAIDHGIEEEELRLRRGKSPQGLLRLVLERKGAEFQLVLADDGAGINAQKVRQLAIEKGLVPADLELSDEEIFPFIMHSGITTKSIVTQISGRGIGMDVVASEIKALGGNITIQSKQDHGASFMINLPLNLSLTQVIVFKLQQDYYAMDVSDISGITRFYREQMIQVLNNAEPVRYLNEYYHARYLPEMFGYHSLCEEGSEMLPAILIATRTERFCLVVDKILGSRELILKALGNQLRGVPGIAGASVLEDGNIVVLLDSPMLLKLIHQNIANQKIISTNRLKSHMVLVVDDSLTTRRVMQRMLERYDYQSMMAKDGVDAWEMMKQQTPDLVITDAEMPRMNGYDLVKKMRKDPLLKTVPVIMITSRYGEQHQRQAYEAGAHVFMSKPFEEALLLKELQYWLDPQSDKKSA